MAQLSIISFGESAGIVIPTEMLESAGLRIGDVVDVTLSDRQLILRPSQDVPAGNSWRRSLKKYSSAGGMLTSGSHKGESLMLFPCNNEVLKICHPLEHLGG